MSVTNINGWTIPDDTEAPDIRSIGTLAAEIDTKVLPKLTAAGRNTLYQSPEEGALCYISDRDNMEVFRDGVWVDASRKHLQLATDYIESTVTDFADIPNLKFDVVAGADYVFRGFLVISGNTSDDAKFIWTNPSSADKRRWTILTLAGTPTDTVMTTSLTLNFASSADPIIYHYWGYINNPIADETVQLQFAKNGTGSATALRVYASSTLSVARITGA